MGWSTALSVGGSLLGGALGGGGNKGAMRLAKHTAQADTMRMAAQQAQNTENFQPYINSGQSNNDFLNYLLGTSKAYNASTPRPTMGDIRSQYAAEIRAAGLAGGKSYGVRDQARSDIYAQDLYKKKLAEWEQGAAGGNGTESSDPLYGSLAKNFSLDDFEKEPGYNFRLDEGEKGINRAASARGGYDSGSTLKALARYNQDYASNEFGNAYNRDNTNKNRMFSYLSDQSKTGLNAASSNAGVSSNLTSNIGNTNSNLANQMLQQGNIDNENQQNSIQSAIGNLVYGLNKNSSVLGNSKNIWGGYGSKGYA